jgi:anti-sigma factor RsiW
MTESDLQAYVDGRLPDARRAEVEAYLASHPDEVARVAAYRAQTEALRAQYRDVVDEAVPERLARAMQPRRARLRRVAAVVAWMTLGGVIGWLLRGGLGGELVASTQTPLARSAALAHVTYTPEVRHPVEVGADQEAHLVTWLSRRLGTKLRVPKLDAEGYNLVGGRLLPRAPGPVAQFMYQDAQGRRLTLYVRGEAEGNRETAFRFAREANVGVFYWIDQGFGYALSGDLERDELLRMANVAYRQLNP